MTTKCNRVTFEDESAMTQPFEIGRCWARIVRRGFAKNTRTDNFCSSKEPVRRYRLTKTDSVMEIFCFLCNRHAENARRAGYTVTPVSWDLKPE